jgi:hypothetical protein
MSSELLGAAQNVLKGNLGGAWDINKGYADAYTDLGIARRFGAAAAAYSLRDIGAMNGRVVKARRSEDDLEEDFSANQVQSGALEDWVNGKLESTLPADVATAAAAYSLRKVKADYSGDAVRIRRDDTDGEADVAFDSEGNVSNNSLVTVITGSGDTGSTLYDYLRANDPDGADAYVDTWYDQAGSNDATQATAGNQPKIAESGALLADGLKFNGNSDNFTITNGVSGRSIFAVTNQNIDTTGGGLTGYGQDGISALLGTTATDSYIFISNNNSAFNSYAISIDGASSDSGQYASNGKTLSSAGGNLGTYGDIPSDTNSLLSIIYGSGDPANAWTRLGSGITGNIFMQGSMSEVILYTSDQSANRFKIESNINNYYGLYNDANDLTQTEWQNTGAESFSSTSTDGFSYSNSASTSFVGVTLKETLAFGDSVFVSFNASGVTHPDSSDQSPQIRLRDAVGGGDGASDIIQVTNGFNAHTLTYSVSGKSNGDNIVFSEGDTVGGTVTISDFKVSRIARNGFVETWYDQSGNGNDAVQATATEQPSIVQNGGIVKLNGKPSVNFDGVDNYFTFTNNLNFNLDPTSVSRPINTIMFVGENTAGSRSFLGDKGSTKNWIAAPYNGTYQFRDNGSTIYDTTVSATLGSQLVLSIQCPSEDDFSIRENGSAKTLGGTNNITAAIGIRDIGVGYTLSGSPNYQTMKAQEFYFHNERLPNDIVDIENDAINYYNIS